MILILMGKSYRYRVEKNMELPVLALKGYIKKCNSMDRFNIVGHSTSLMAGIGTGL